MDMPAKSTLDAPMWSEALSFNRLKKYIIQFFKKNNKGHNHFSDEDLLNFALKSTGAGAWSWNMVANTIVWDEKMHQLFGIKLDETPKSYEDFINLVYPEDREHVGEEVKNALKMKSEFEQSFRVRHSDSTLHYIGVKGKPHFSKLGKPEFMVGVCWDITTRRLAEDEVKHAKEAAEEASRLKSDFMAKVSHDLRSPLNGIIGFAELMYHGKVGPIASNHKEYLGDILTSSRQLLLLINNILDIAKVEAGKMEFHPEKVDLNQILNETREIFLSLIENKNIKLEIHVDPALSKVVLDSVRFKQVLYNYVSNALKCSKDSGKVIIHIDPEDSHMLRLAVEDFGIGIRKEDMSKLFVEFQQIDQAIAKQYPSTGLGLALTKHIVEAQGGRVGVISEFGKGSTFFAVMPFEIIPTKYF